MVVASQDLLAGKRYCLCLQIFAKPNFSLFAKSNCFTVFFIRFCCRIIFYVMKTSREGNPLKPRSSGLSSVNAYSHFVYSFVTELILMYYTFATRTAFLTEDGLFEMIRSSNKSKSATQPESKKSLDTVVSSPKRKLQNTSNFKSHLLSFFISLMICLFLMI